MIDWLRNLWRSHQFKQALKQNNSRQANLIFRQIEKSEAKLNCLEQLYQKQQQTAASLKFYQKETKLIKQRLQTVEATDYCLQPDLNFCDRLNEDFKLRNIERSLIQCTGIESKVFSELEIALTNFLDEEIDKVSTQVISKELTQAVADIKGLKQGIDPQYNFRLSPHIYLLTYFLENTYCAYLAWFFIYQRQLLPKSLKILDLAAGPGTVIYGLALLLLSAKNFYALPNLHINYYSLELRDRLQYSGLQFWRRYIESLSQPINAYFRFNSVDLFDYHNYLSKLPKCFFDFVVISHCFFYEPQARQKSHQIYRQIFQQSLTSNGRVLLIVQGRKLLNIYDSFSGEDSNGETRAIKIFLEELGLNLEWYQYLTSTGKRTPMKKGFGRFAAENLPPQNYLQKLKEKYMKQKYVSHYAIDDYIILAKVDESTGNVDK